MKTNCVPIGQTRRVKQRCCFLPLSSQTRYMRIPVYGGKWRLDMMLMMVFTCLPCKLALFSEADEITVKNKY
eukprot:5715664-Ditylum_brightwellii.AAC.1